MTLYVDPPEGWRYGFPKAVPKEWEAHIIAWLIKEGYPPEKIQTAGDAPRLFAIARRGAAVQWRPIEEAPKDGTRYVTHPNKHKPTHFCALPPYPLPPPPTGEKEQDGQAPMTTERDGWSFR